MKINIVNQAVTKPLRSKAIRQLGDNKHSLASTVLRCSIFLFNNWKVLFADCFGDVEDCLGDFASNVGDKKYWFGDLNNCFGDKKYCFGDEEYSKIELPNWIFILPKTTAEINETIFEYKNSTEN